MPCKYIDWIVAAGRLGCLFIILIAASKNADALANGLQSSTLHRALAQGSVRIGYANEAPFAYLDVFSGKVTGEAPEVARVVLARMGITHMESVLTEFGSLIPGLQAGRFDIIAAGMYVLPERCQQVLFSNPSYSTGEALLVQQGKAPELHSYADILSYPQEKLGVVAGSIEAKYAQDSGIPTRQLVYFPDGPSAVEGVLANRAIAYAASLPSARSLQRKTANRGIVLASPFREPIINGRPARGYGAFGFRRSDADFVAAFNQELSGFIGSSDHLKLISPFGFTAAELPGKVTSAALCRART